MARLHAAQRRALPSSDFAGPNRTDPIEDANHARAALGLSGRQGPAIHARVVAAVRARYPGLVQRHTQGR